MPKERVHLIDVPVAAMLKWISNWGSSSGEIDAAIERLPSPGKTRGKG